MSDSELKLKQKIQAVIQGFEQGDLFANALKLFKTLGYNTDRQNPLSIPTYSEFKASFVETNSRFNEKKALVDEWKSVNLLFQLTKEELSREQSLFDTNEVDKTVIEAYLFFAIELNQDRYSRTAFSQITREVNKLFAMPVMILFKHGKSITISIIRRRLHKKDSSKDVLEKVTLIKDIFIAEPHRAHIEILFDLSLGELLRVHNFTNFVELHNAWRKTLDIKELNKRFYRELSNWYFWAMNHVQFPDDVEKDKDVRNATSLIRLITRVIFLWFIREKGLVPDILFDRKEVERILKDFLKTRESCTYYQAILQNLFFGTLNQKMDERGFASEGSFHDNQKNYGVKNLFRYSGHFAIDKNTVLKLFQNIPFLNGGLFDCLDKEDKAGKVVYVDGFSRNSQKQAIVPDFLFFSTEEEYDLNEMYGTKNKSYRVKGLLDILTSYKFTITENTPIEEEIALDPELLGKVFENLLASYNPETQTTARKQTGSFYTPREIVDYMVDESLLAYLANSLNQNSKKSPNSSPQDSSPQDSSPQDSSPQDSRGESDESRLRQLFAYTENPNPFDAGETEKLIAAIDRCKILDPACGSGAFPMGILHKLVHILHKLDPKNEMWKEKQCKKAQAIDDVPIREKVIEDIEEAFANNELDYGRKLYLIENCIYGVDIQPIAIQISKLRFFISLIVDQKTDAGKANLGIRSLPNLETKFVAANTLIGLEKPDQQGNLFQNPEIEKVASQIKTLRHNYFGARSRKEKLGYQKQDQELRKQIAQLLMQDEGWGQKSATQIAEFAPYDQNRSSPFFDPGWMFGVKRGFHVVIGNPPYIQIQSFSGKEEQSQWQAQNYATYAKTGDVYCLFYERGFQLLATGGVLCYITSNKWMRAGYGKAMRKYFLTHGTLQKLLDFGDSPIFENTTTYTNIAVWSQDKGKIAASTNVYDLSQGYEVDAELAALLEKQSQSQGQPLFTENSFVIAQSAQSSLKKRIETVGTPLKEWDINIYRGILTGLNEAFILEQKKRDELVAADPKSAKILKPILRGRDIKRYKAEWAGLWLVASHNGYQSANGRDVPPVNLKRDYPAVFQHLEAVGKAIEQGEIKIKGKGLYHRDDQGKHWSNLRDCAYYEEFGKEKIAWGNLAQAPQFTIVESDIFINAPSPLITPARRYILAVLNSLLCKIFLSFVGIERSGGFYEYKPMYVEQLPIPKIPDNAQKPYDALVDSIQFAYTHDLEKEAKTLEWLVDCMVFGLYFEPEMKAAQCYVNDHIAQAVQKPFPKEDGDAAKTECVKTLVKFCDDDPTTRHALEYCRIVEPVKIVLGM